MADEIGIRAQCYCGACEIRISAQAKDGASSYCHCSICRRMSGSPIMVSLLLPNACVDLKGDCTEIKTSKFVTRKRCRSCGSPLAASLGKIQTAVPLSLFSRQDIPTSWLPRHHLHYSDRILDYSHDGLPKFMHGARGPLLE